MTLQTRYTELQSAGRVPLYGYELAIVDDPSKADRVLIKLGYQPTTARYLYLLDLDGRNHGPSFDADTARTAFECAYPELARKIVWARSRSRLGWHGWFETYQEMATGRLYVDGAHVGELIGGHTFDPGDITIPILSPTENEWFRDYWTLPLGAIGGARWADRAKQGETWTRGSQHIPVPLARLRTFLQNDTGPVGKQLDALFDSDKPFNRSDKAGSLMQTLMLWAHKLPGCANASFTVRCANVKAYWMAAESYGKADEKDYDQSKDGDSLIAQIVNGDLYGPRDNPRQWKQPFWTKSQIASAPAPEPSPEPRRPAHRPAGDREKHIKRLRRLLERRALDYYGKIPYYVDDLAEELGVSRRSVQNYLQSLARGDQPLIVRGQDQTGPGGRAWLVLLPAFWGANNSENAANSAQESAPIWGANETATERTLTPQTAENTPQYIEDHLNPCAPAPSPQAKSSAEPVVAPRPSAYELARTFFASAVDPLTGEVWERHTFARFKRFAAAHGPCHLPTLARAFAVEQKRARYHRQDAKTVEKVRKMDDGELKRRSRSVASRAAQLHKKGSRQALVWDRLAGIYAAEEARRAPPDQLTMHEQWAQVGAEYEQAHQALKKHARPVARAARPAGAQDGGAPLPAPAGAAPVGIVERLRLLKAEREAAHG